MAGRDGWLKSQNGQNRARPEAKAHAKHTGRPTPRRNGGIDCIAPLHTQLPTDATRASCPCNKAEIHLRSRLDDPKLWAGFRRQAG